MDALLDTPARELLDFLHFIPLATQSDKTAAGVNSPPLSQIRSTATQFGRILYPHHDSPSRFGLEPPVREFVATDAGIRRMLSKHRTVLFDTIKPTLEKQAAPVEAYALQLLWKSIFFEY